MGEPFARRFLGLRPKMDALGALQRLGWDSFIDAGGEMQR